LARFFRLDGRRVMFLTGTDEHGQKVQQAARAAGLDPQDFCDQVSSEFRRMNELMNISNDDFIRTTEPRHIRACQAFWERLKQRGEIYLGTFAGWYSVRDEAFYDTDELIEGKAPTGADVQWLEEPNYCFRLSAWQDRLLQFYEQNPEFIAPASRRNEVISFVRGGLRDLSISRSSFNWGIPVPDDPDHVMYVWLDALTNYISAIGYPDIQGEAFSSYWPAQLHMVGKDIIRFHCVYWPAFLMAAGLQPPRRVFAHGWWTVEGQKMSKSLGNFISPKELVDRYGVDAIRYFMLRELPFGNDGDLSHQAIIRRINADLANGLGNLAQRVLSMVQHYCDGRVPSPSTFHSDDEKLLALARGQLARLRPHYAEQQFHRVLEELFKVIDHSNSYVDEQAPWRLAHADPNRLHAVLYTLLETIRHLAILFQPVVPAAAATLLDQLGVHPDTRNFHALESTSMVPGIKLPKPEVIFPRYTSAS
jgi:methionyl-tRNA synthetase